MALLPPAGIKQGKLLDTECDTLIEMRTDVHAVPHAGLGFHFLRIRIRTTGALGSSNGERAKLIRRNRSDRVMAFRA